MSYAGLGQVAAPASGAVKVGELAKTDPILGGASLLASNVMLYLSRQPKAARRNLMRIKLNGLYPGMGDAAVTKLDSLAARGTPPDQALFDAVRLTIANRIFDWAGNQAARRSGMSGLGDFASDAQTFACTAASTSAGAGGWVGAFRPGADTSIIGGANAAASISNCNLPTLQAQAQIANQQAQTAMAQASQSYGLQTTRTVQLAAVGIGGILALAIAAKIAFK